MLLDGIRGAATVAHLTARHEHAAGRRKPDESGDAAHRLVGTSVPGKSRDAVPGKVQ